MARTQGVEQRKSVGIWIRVSTEDQARGESPENHEKRASYYAESKGWTVREVYHLEGLSGKSVWNLPEAQRMLGHIRSGHITGLIFSKLARLARNTRELLDFADVFREHNADLVSLAESIDTTSPAGRLFYTMIAAMAQWEREETSDRVAASVPIRAKLGKPLGGAAPFGYRWEARELVPDPQEAPVRKRLYDLFAEHGRKKTVARLLNEAGHRTRNGSKFTDTTVARLLKDPTAKGLRRANYTSSTGEGKHWRLKPENEWVLTPVEAIVSDELWERCNAILERNRDRKPAKKTVHLFAGVVFCHCGQRMYVFTNSRKYVCPKCRTKIGTEDLEAVFQHKLRDFVFSPEEVAAHLAAADDTLKAKEEVLDALGGERQKLAAEMTKLYKLHMADQLSAESFGALWRPLEERAQQIDDELPRLQADLDYRKIQIHSSDEIIAEARDLYGRWPDLTFEEKRQIVETITERIEITSDAVIIHLSYDPSASKDTTNTQRRNVRAATTATRAANANAPSRVSRRIGRGSLDRSSTASTCGCICTRFRYGTSRIRTTRRALPWFEPASSTPALFGRCVVAPSRGPCGASPRCASRPTRKTSSRAPSRGLVSRREAIGACSVSRERSPTSRRASAWTGTTWRRHSPSGRSIRSRARHTMQARDPPRA